MLAIRLELSRKPVHHKIEIQCADDADVKFVFAQYSSRQAINSVKNYNSAQIFWLVGIEAFLHASVIAQKLCRNDKRSQKRRLGSLGLQLEEEIAGLSDTFGSALAYRNDCATKLFHLEQNFALCLHA